MSLVLVILREARDESLFAVSDSELEATVLVLVSLRSEAFVSEVSGSEATFVRVSRLLSAAFSSDGSDSASLVLVSLRSDGLGGGV